MVPLDCFNWNELVPKRLIHMRTNKFNRISSHVARLNYIKSSDCCLFCTFYYFRDYFKWMLLKLMFKLVFYVCRSTAFIRIQTNLFNCLLNRDTVRKGKRNTSFVCYWRCLHLHLWTISFSHIRPNLTYWIKVKWDSMSTFVAFSTHNFAITQHNRTSNEHIRRTELTERQWASIKYNWLARDENETHDA